MQSFLDSHDGGRDGAFTGEWVASGQEALRGPFVIQCKFTSREGYTLKASDLLDEIDKARKLVKQGLCETYVLMTNAGLTGAGDGKIKELLEDVGVKHVTILGSTWINQQILENKRLRMLVPRVYGLGDLSQILDERAYTQARSILESMREDLAKVVITDAYRNSARAIDKYSFVLLIGEPASGKTTIASLLSMAALDHWGASILKLDNPADLVARWNPDEPSQFFWLDDAFGVTQYEESQALRWNHVLPQIQPMLSNGAKIIMTSRDYIYSRARKSLKDSAFPLLNESQVVIDVHDLSHEEKEQILYNHIKLGTQTPTFRTKIKPHLHDVASHPRFIPETARRLGNPFFTKGLFINADGISQFVEERERLMQEILRGLDMDSWAALALVYMRRGRLDSPIVLEPTEAFALERLGSTLGKCLVALHALKGSLVLFSRINGEPVWQFRHPTVGDAYATVLAESPEHLDIFIEGSEVEHLIGQVTCGDMGYENSIVVPEALFPLMIKRLKDMRQGSSAKATILARVGVIENLQAFLTYRCSRAFLSLYLQDDPKLLVRVSQPGLFLNAVQEVPLAIRLHEFALLPEERRRTFIETVSEYALEGRDASALVDEDIKSIFTAEELEELVRRLEFELLPRLNEIRDEWEYDYSLDERPEQHMQPLLDLFRALRTQFYDDEGVARIIDEQIWVTTEWVRQNTIQEVDGAPRQLGEFEATEIPQSTRSIFDDIDAYEVSSGA